MSSTLDPAPRSFHLVPLLGGIGGIAVSAAAINMANATRGKDDTVDCSKLTIDTIKRNRIIGIVGVLVAIGLVLYSVSPLLVRGARAGRDVYRRVNEPSRRQQEPNGGG